MTSGSEGRSELAENTRASHLAWGPRLLFYRMATDRESYRKKPPDRAVGPKLARAFGWRALFQAGCWGVWG